MNIAKNACFVKSGLEFKFVVAEGFLNAESRTPTDIFYSFDYSWDGLVHRIRNAFVRAETFVSQWQGKGKCLDCWSYLVISDESGRMLEMELDEPSALVGDIEIYVARLVDWVREAIACLTDGFQFDAVEAL